MKRRRLSDLVDPYAPPPSKVVHVRAVPDGCLNTEMRTAVQEFGALSHIKIMPDRRQALLEFEQIESAIACVNKSKVEDGIAVRERKSYFNFSKSQEINRGGSTMAPGPANRILLISIQNPLHPVNPDVLNQICRRFGNVLRVVMMRRRGVQALVEFETVEVATQAKMALNNECIYEGCCQLKIEFSTAEKVNVKHNNDPETMLDFTMPMTVSAQSAGIPSSGGWGQQQQQYGMQSGGASAYGASGYGHQQQAAAHSAAYGHGQQQQHGQGQQQQQSQAGQSPYGAYTQQQSGARGSFSGAGPSMRSGSVGSIGTPFGSQQGGGGWHPSSSQGAVGGPHGGGGHAHPHAGGGHGGGMGDGAMPGAVLMIYQLNPQRFNCQTLFNLCSLFGNPIKIKFLIRKPGTAMVEYTNASVAAAACPHLHELEVFGTKLECGKSRAASIGLPRTATVEESLPDGTPAFMDFTPLQKLWRFPQNFDGHQNGRKPHGKAVCLHYYNAPKNTTKETLFAVFEKLGVQPPLWFERFNDDETKRNDRGLMEWQTLQAAAEAVVMANNYALETPAGGPCTIKLAFSPRTVDREPKGGGGTGDGGAAAAGDAAAAAAAAATGGSTEDAKAGETAAAAAEGEASVGNA